MFTANGGRRPCCHTGVMGENEPRGAKERLRERILARRRVLDHRERARVGSRVRDTLMEVPWIAMGATVACYYSVGGEPDTRKLVTALWKRGTYVLLPVFLPSGDLDWAAFDGPDSLVPARHGLLEPDGHRYGPEALAGVDAVICPALAVDARGTRLGRGAGCYDRALAHKGPRTPAVAVVHDEELVESLPAEPHDRPVDAAITPNGSVRVFDTGVWPVRD